MEEERREFRDVTAARNDRVACARHLILFREISGKRSYAGSKSGLGNDTNYWLYRCIFEANGIRIMSNFDVYQYGIVGLLLNGFESCLNSLKLQWFGKRSQDPI